MNDYYERDKTFSYKVVLACFILTATLLAIISTKQCSEEPIPEPQPIEKIFNNTLRVELDGDYLRYYYIDYVYKRNGKFKVWETTKVYVK